jgi:hypothetical protein
MGQTESVPVYARNVFGGEEDIYANSEYYKMIANDDIKYIDVIKKRFTNVLLSDGFTSKVESDPFVAYNKLILSKWDDWKFSVSSNKCKISTELVKNLKLTCKYTSDIKFITKKLEDKFDIDYNFLCFSILKLINDNKYILKTYYGLEPLYKAFSIYLDEKYKNVNETEYKKLEILDKFQNILDYQYKTLSYNRDLADLKASSTMDVDMYEESEESKLRRKEEEQRNEEWWNDDDDDDNDYYSNGGYDSD